MSSLKSASAPSTPVAPTSASVQRSRRSVIHTTCVALASFATGADAYVGRDPTKPFDFESTDGAVFGRVIRSNPLSQDEVFAAMHSCLDINQFMPNHVWSNEKLGSMTLIPGIGTYQTILVNGANKTTLGCMQGAIATANATAKKAIERDNAIFSGVWLGFWGVVALAAVAVALHRSGTLQRAANNIRQSASNTGQFARSAQAIVTGRRQTYETVVDAEDFELSATLSAESDN